MCAQFDFKWSMIILRSKTRTYLGKLVNHLDQIPQYVTLSESGIKVYFCH